MSGTHYTLERDQKNPMDLVKEKACARCNTVKPNNFKHFGKKFWRSRTAYTTVDVCIECANRAQAQKRQEKEDHEKAYRNYVRLTELNRFRKVKGLPPLDELPDGPDAPTT